MRKECAWMYRSKSGDKHEYSYRRDLSYFDLEMVELFFDIPSTAKRIKLVFDTEPSPESQPVEMVRYKMVFKDFGTNFLALIVYEEDVAKELPGVKDGEEFYCTIEYEE